MQAYLDNSATTRVSEDVANAMLDMMVNTYGNPSSLHRMGFEAQQKMEQARLQVAKALKCQKEEIVFTSGGTEGNNLCVLGGALAKRRRGNRVVCTAYEHSSVEESLQQLEKEGFEVIRVRPQANGEIDPQEFLQNINDNTVLASFMFVNNETGAVLPMQSLAGQIKKQYPNVTIHVDAVQALGKLEIDLAKAPVDLLTISAHKIHGPKGVGAVFLKKGARVLPRQFGGLQEKKIRPGTEAAPSIVGFGLACQNASEHLQENYKSVQALNAYLKERLGQIPGICLNSPENALPYVLNISCMGVRSEIMLHFLEEREVYVSSGSACAKGEKSHVLKAMGLEDKRIDSAIRISFSHDTTQAQVDALIDALKAGMQTIRR